MMRGWIKWVAALIGFGVFGYFGGVIGFIIGSLLDRRSATEWDNEYTNGGYSAKNVYQRSTTGDFAASLLVLTAAVMKADDKVLKSELNFVKEFYLRQFGERKTQQQMGALKELLKQNIDVREVSHQIRYQMQYASRLQL